MFGERLHNLRSEKGLSMKKAGSIVGVSDAAWNKYEKNRAEPSYGTLMKIADFFEVSIDYLLGRTNIKEENVSNANTNKQAFLKKLDKGILIDPSELINFTNSLEKTIENYNNGNIDENTFSNLLNLLDSTVLTFNNMVNTKN